MTQQEKFDNVGKSIINLLSQRLQDNLGNRLTPELSNGLLSVMASGMNEAFAFLKREDALQDKPIDAEPQSK